MWDLWWLSTPLYLVSRLTLRGVSLPSTSSNNVTILWYLLPAYLTFNMRIILKEYMYQYSFIGHVGCGLYLLQSILLSLSFYDEMGNMSDGWWLSEIIAQSFISHIDLLLNHRNSNILHLSVWGIYYTIGWVAFCPKRITPPDNWSGALTVIRLSVFNCWL